MKAKDIMIEDVYKVSEDDNVRSVIAIFLEHGISGLPVVNQDSEIVGYISDGDIMRYIGKHKDVLIDALYTIVNVQEYDLDFDNRIRHIMDLDVMSIAQPKVTTINTEDDAEDIATILGEKRIKKLPVEKNNKLTGIVSRGDVIRRTFESML